MTDFSYGQIFKLSKTGNPVDSDFYVLSPDGPDFFLLHNLSYGSKLTGKFPHGRKPITLDMIESAGSYFIRKGWVFTPLKNVQISYDIMVVQPSPRQESVKLRGGKY